MLAIDISHLGWELVSAKSLIQHIEKKNILFSKTHLKNKSHMKRWEFGSSMNEDEKNKVKYLHCCIMK